MEKPIQKCKVCKQELKRVKISGQYVYICRCDNLIKLSQKRAKCKHLRAIVKGSESFGRASCPDCQSEVHVSDVFNNLFVELRKALKIEEAKAK